MPRPPRVLHVLAQRPGFTGSGVTLDALVRHAAGTGWEQRALVGVPAGEPAPAVGGLAAERVSAVTFGPGGQLPFPVPGMSDVMPYPSRRFSSLSGDELAAYRGAWLRGLARAGDGFRPDVVHSHHAWILTSLVPDALPGVPVVGHCHATGLRQRRLCPHLADEVARGCRRCSAWLAMHDEQADELVRVLEIPATRVRVVASGFREEVFHDRPRRETRPPRIVYAGKLADAKGLPWLLEALDRLRTRRAVELHVAGAGDGPEAEAIRRRMEQLDPAVRYHGMLEPARLADLLRTARVFVLPSFYEGLPLVLVEALACGCRLVATDLPGIRHWIAPRVGRLLTTVDPPRLRSVDRPDPSDLARFVADLEGALAQALDADDGPLDPRALAAFTWSAVARRVEDAWRDAAGLPGKP